MFQNDYNYQIKMPTLLLKDGFKFFFYANEHLPKHIHVTKGDEYAKINLETMTFVENFFNRSSTRRIMVIVNENKEYFIRRWYEYFKR
jgi:hypothetical protein